MDNLPCCNVFSSHLGLINVHCSIFIPPKDGFERMHFALQYLNNSTKNCFLQDLVVHLVEQSPDFEYLYEPSAVERGISLGFKNDFLVNSSRIHMVKGTLDNCFHLDDLSFLAKYQYDMQKALNGTKLPGLIGKHPFIQAILQEQDLSYLIDRRRLR